MGREWTALTRRKGLAIALAFFALGYLAGADRSGSPRVADGGALHAVAEVATQVATLSHAVRTLAEAVASTAAWNP